MLKTTILGFGAAAALSLAAAVTPAFANYGGCTENPEGKGCPGALTPPPAAASTSSSQHMKHAHYYRAPYPSAKG